MQSSTYLADDFTQTDGRRYVHELHTDVAGLVWPNDYLAEAGANYAALLAQHAAALDLQLAQDEVLAVMATTDINLVYQTPAEFSQRYWRVVEIAFTTADKFRYHQGIWWLWSRIQDGDLTNDNARVAYNTYFGKALTLVQWNTLVTNRFVPIKDRYIGMINETMV